MKTLADLIGDAVSDNNTTTQKAEQDIKPTSLMWVLQTVDKVAKARRFIIAIELYRMAKVTLAKTKSINSVYRKVA